jgi:hypothetical protein
MEQYINTAPFAEKPMWEFEEWAENGMKKALELLESGEEEGD